MAVGNEIISRFCLHASLVLRWSSPRYARRHGAVLLTALLLPTIASAQHFAKQ